MDDGQVFVGSCQACENVPCTCKHVKHVSKNRAAPAPGPATEVMLEMIERELRDLMRCGEPLEDDDLAIIRSTAGFFLRVLAEHNRPAPTRDEE